MPGNAEPPSHIHEFANIGGNSGSLDDFFHSLFRASRGGLIIARTQWVDFGSIARGHDGTLGRVALELRSDGEHIKNRTGAREWANVYRLVGTCRRPLIISLLILGSVTKWGSASGMASKSPGAKISIYSRFEKMFFRSTGDGLAKTCAFTNTCLRRRPSAPYEKCHCLQMVRWS